MRRERRRKRQRRPLIRTATGRSAHETKSKRILRARTARRGRGPRFARNTFQVVPQVEGKMTPQEMRVLYDYNAWANHRSLEAASALTAEKFLQPMGSSFGSVRDTLGHIFGAEWIWLERFQGR